MTLLLALSIVQLPPIQPFVAELRTAVASGNQARIEKLFRDPADDAVLFRMGQGRGLRNCKVAVMPAPPGWEPTGNYWAIIHTRQDIEDYHDPVYPIVVSGVQWKLGSEIAEDATTGASMRHADLDVRIMPASRSVGVQAKLDLTITALRRAPLFRLNDNYRFTAVPTGKAIEVADAIPAPAKGDWVHAGSLLVPWDRTVASSLSFSYGAALTAPNEDKVDDHSAFVTAWWVPSLGRLPFTTATTLHGPKAWVLQSEGEPLGSAIEGDEQVRRWKCDVPISYPKVIGGKYVLAAEKRVADKTFRSYHFEPIDKARADKDVQTMADSIAWYEDHLGPFPFKEYNCFDSDGYYGIESYNYTLLSPRITSWAVSHEAGHTYFGGLVPCAYVNDTWNESMTQYVDSVLRQNNRDRTLDGAYGSLRLAVPLTEMNVAHEYGSATYMRGAFVLRMLENEIGTPKMYQGIRGLIADRVGKDTTWYDLRPYFERASGKKLDWFWGQWVSGASFPKLEIVDAEAFPSTSGTSVHVTVRQSGTRSPFRLRFKVIARGRPDVVKEQVVEMSSPEAVFTLNLGKGVQAYEATLDTFGYALTPRVQPVKVKL